jgi:hypothetical protein
VLSARLEAVSARMKGVGTLARYTGSSVTLRLPLIFDHRAEGRLH